MTPRNSWTSRHPPRDWQGEALRQWEASNYRGIAEVVTGAGKTVFAEMCMLKFRERYPNAVFLIVVPTRALQDQWSISLQEELGISADEIATFSGEGRPDGFSVVNILVLNTARELLEHLALELPTMLIVDECHRAASPENAKAIHGSHRGSLGISATPRREYDDGLREVLIPALGPVIFTYDYDEALRDGVVTPFRLTNIAIDLLPDEEEEYKQLTGAIARRRRQLRGAGASDDPRLRRLLQRRAAVAAAAEMRIPVAARLAEEHRNGRVLIFHEQIEAAEKIQNLLRDRGVNATIYHSKVPTPIRQDNLRMFRRGLFEVLVSCRALDEGINVPETTVAVVASSTASARQRIQRLGRVLRPAHGKDEAHIFTIYATELEERRLSAESRRLVGAKSVTWQKVRTPLSARGGSGG